MPKQKTTDYKRAFNAKNYDRIEIVVPKGQKATIQAAADKEGDSINGFVNKAVLARIGLEEWPKDEQA